jgi:hypothetical protein
VANRSGGGGSSSSKAPSVVENRWEAAMLLEQAKLQARLQIAVCGVVNMLLVRGRAHRD